MGIDLTLSLEDRPGTVADAADALGKADINIQGACGVSVGGKGVAHFLVDDAERARTALEAIGAKIEAESEVLVTEIDNRPGALGELARKIADAGVNLTILYLATDTRLVLGATDIAQLRSALMQ